MTIMWIFRIRSEVTNFCSTELKNWTREPKRWEGLGKGMIAVLAKLPMRNVSEVSANYTEYIYNIYALICRIASRSLCVCSLVRPVIFKVWSKVPDCDWYLCVCVSPSKRDVQLYKNYAVFRWYEVCIVLLYCSIKSFSENENCMSSLHKSAWPTNTIERESMTLGWLILSGKHV